MTGRGAMRASSGKGVAAGPRRRARMAQHFAFALLCLAAAAGCTAHGPAAGSREPAIVPLALEQDRQFWD